MARWIAGRAMRLMALIFGLCGGAQAEPVTVFAAASLKTALDQIAADFEEVTDHAVVVSYAGTSALARQISLGAPADIMVSASTDWMDWLEDSGAIEAASRVDIARNQLVLIANGPDAGPIAPERDALLARLGNGRIAMALVDAVPAGIYGRATFEHFDLWTEVAPQVAQTDNVRAALALVATGAVPFGVVYATDVRAEPRVSRVTTFPSDSHPAITYPAALVTGRATAAAKAFLAHLRSDAARNRLAQHGFLTRGAQP